jgi:regulator of ribonuclease activity B
VGLRDLLKRRKGGAAGGDRLVLDQLRRAGADLSQPREVLHYAYASTRDGADALAAAVRGDGYDVEVRDSATGGPRPWLVLATAQRVVDEQTAEAATRRFTELAGEHGAEYDGWEASV